MQVCGSRNLVKRDTLLFAIDFDPSLFKALQAVVQSGLSLWEVHYDCERQSRQAKSGTLACGQNPQQKQTLEHCIRSEGGKQKKPPLEPPLSPLNVT